MSKWNYGITECWEKNYGITEWWVKNIMELQNNE